MAKRILVVDVGGTHVKLHVTGQEETLKIPSGKDLTPARMMKASLAVLAERGWRFDAVTVGIPAPVVAGKVALEPANLGRGWTRFDFSAAAGRPVRVVNDAAMQALGSYGGKGTMLFLGLGTGLGAALVADGTLIPLELARMPYRRGELEDYVGERALKRLGKTGWRKSVDEVVRAVAAAFVVDEVVLGGGNSRRLKELPPRTRVGSNAFAMIGGERLWQEQRRAGSQRFEAAHGRRARARR
jgi:predicted NBD/HSP70 family sugar kinase